MINLIYKQAQLNRLSDFITELVDGLVLSEKDYADVLIRETETQLEVYDRCNNLLISVEDGWVNGNPDDFYVESPSGLACLTDIMNRVFLDSKTCAESKYIINEL